MNSILRKEATLDEAVTFFIRTVNNAQAKFEMIQICLRARFALEEDFIAQESSVRDLIFNSFDDSLKDKFNAHSAILNKKYSHLSPVDKSRLRKTNNNIPVALAFIKFTRDKTKKLFNKLKDVIFTDPPVMPSKPNPKKRSRLTSPSPNTDSVFNVLDETREERYLRRSLPIPIIPVVIQESIVFTPESVYNSDSDDSVNYESGLDVLDVDDDPLPDFLSCPIISRLSVEYENKEDKRLLLQDKLKNLRNVLRFWDKEYNDICKSLAETDDQLCNAKYCFINK